MQKDLDPFPISPFQEKIEVENFFSGAGRNELFSQMQEAMRNGSAVLTLTGEEGCGKTMMCHMLKHATPDNSKTILFPQTVESYEDVIQILALELGLERPSSGGQSVRDTQAQITDYLCAKSLHIIVIFDEAENIYLATLERIRKMLDQIIAAGCFAHMVFAGRNNLIENCEQLTICDFQQNEEQHFALLPFSEDATFEYLTECAKKLADKGHAASFTDDVMRKIYSISKGNVRMINILAEESLKNQGDDTSFMVLLDSVSDDADQEEQEGVHKKVLRFLSNYTSSSYIPLVGGLCLCGLALLLFLWPAEEVKEPEVENLNDAQLAFIENAPEVVYKDTEESTLKPSVEEKSWKIPENQNVEKDAPVADETTAETPQPSVAIAVVADEEIEEVAEQEELPAVPEEEVAEQEELPAVLEEEVAEQEELPAVLEEEVAEQEELPAVLEEVAAQEELPVLPIEIIEKDKEKREIEVEQAPIEKAIVTLRQIPPLKRIVAEQPVVAQTTINVQPRSEAAKMLTANENDTVDEVYQKRVLAGTLWESHSKDQMYTIQLMVLTSKNAEENLKGMLAKDVYRELANNFFIFQKSIDAEVIFVFYGEYNNITVARDARDSIPEVLREHKPYAISIADAVKKVQN